MAVVTMAVNVFIMPMPVAEIHFPDEAAVDEQGNSPVDGGLGNLGALLLQLQVEAVHVKVLMNLKNFLEDQLPLRRPPQPPLANIIMENLKLGLHA
jgi:hypothetical protein